MQVGPAGIGKSQLCHMLAVSALLPLGQQQQAIMQACIIPTTCLTSC